MGNLALIPPANGKRVLITNSQSTKDIIAELIKGTSTFQDQTREFAKSIKYTSVRDACKYIWSAIRLHVNYKADSNLNQMLKSPSRLFQDKQGDCKSYSLFIGTCLKNLGIPFSYRFVSFRQNDPTPTHVYVVAYDENGHEIKIDAVLKDFDREAPHKHQTDKKMLSLLTGIGCPDQEMGKISLKKKSPEHKAANKAKRQAKTKKVLNKLKNLNQKVKKFNPATSLIRNGLLLAIDTNIFKLRSKLKWAFATEQQARAKGLDLNEWRKLVAVGKRVESKFVSLGGNANNLRNAFLKKGLAGIGFVPAVAAPVAAATPVIIVILDWIKQNVNFDKLFKAVKKKDKDDEEAINPPSTDETTMDKLKDAFDNLTSKFQNNSPAGGNANDGNLGPANYPGGGEGDTDKDTGAPQQSDDDKIFGLPKPVVYIGGAVLAAKLFKLF